MMLEIQSYEHLERFTKDLVYLQCETCQCKTLHILAGFRPNSRFDCLKCQEREE